MPLSPSDKLTLRNPCAPRLRNGRGRVGLRRGAVRDHHWQAAGNGEDPTETPASVGEGQAGPERCSRECRATAGTVS